VVLYTIGSRAADPNLWDLPWNSPQKLLMPHSRPIGEFRDVLVAPSELLPMLIRRNRLYNMPWLNDPKIDIRAYCDQEIYV
jgi:hypothetical protein